MRHWQSPGPPRELVERVAAGILGAGVRVLDLGCGAGAEAVYLAAHGCRVQGVDSSAEALVLARRAAAEAAVEVEWIEASVLALPLADQSVDFAYDRGCLHLFERPARQRYAGELARVLVPGGSLLLRGARYTDEEAGLFAIDGKSLDRVFAKHGFQRQRVQSRPLTAAAGDIAGNLVLLHSTKQ